MGSGRVAAADPPRRLAYDVLQWGCTGQQSQDATPFIQNLLNVAPPYSDIVIPSGKTFRLTAAVQENALQINKVGQRIIGEGTFYVDDPGEVYPSGVGSKFYSVYMAAPHTSVEGVTFQGLNDPFAGIDAFVSHTASCILFNANDLTVKNVTFRNLFGHAIRENQHRQRFKVYGCRVEYCTNGLNVNGDYTEYVNNVLLWTNGIECAGSYCLYAYNDLTDSHGISIGGHSGPEATYDCWIHHNTMLRIRRGGGITMAAGSGVRCEDNTILLANYGMDGTGGSDHGVTLYDSTADNVPGWVTGPAGTCYIRRNTVTSLGVGGHLMWIKTGSGTILEDNVLSSNPGCLYAMLIQNANNCVARRNTVSGVAGGLRVEPLFGEQITAYVLSGGNVGSITGSSDATLLPVP